MIEIDNEKLNEAAFLIEKVSNEFDIFMRLHIEIGCYGKEEVPEDEHDYQDGDEWIYRDGKLTLNFELYISEPNGSHYDFDSLDDVIKKIESFYKKQSLRRNRPRSKIMQSQDAIGEEVNAG